MMKKHIQEKNHEKDSTNLEDGHKEIINDETAVINPNRPLLDDNGKFPEN